MTMRSSIYILPAIAVSLVLPAPLSAAASPRDALIQAAFSTNDKAAALVLINGALTRLQATLGQSPNDRESLIQQGIGLGYRGQLTHSFGDARTARDELAALVQKYPNDPESQIALGGWHLSVIAELGSFLGGTALGANRKAGLAALDRAVALDGRHAFYTGYAGLSRLRLDARDPVAAALIDRAANAEVTTTLDRIFQTAARRVAARLHAGDTAGAAALAKQTLPFGAIA
jgi:hypothetical protein